MGGGFERGRGGGGDGPDHPDDALDKPVVGKRTLVQQEYGEGPAGLDPATVHQAAQHGTSGGGAALPYIDQIQRAFGKHDVSGIRAHTDERAAAGARAMGAEAFADGDHVAFHGAPSLHTAAHEAAHVVQQRGGVQLKGGVGEAGDSHEQHANAVADLVVQGKSAESLLDRYGGGGGGARRGAVQRLESNFGTFATTKYDKVGPAGKEHGLDIKLTFDPDVKKVDATKIGLTQAIRYQMAGTPVSLYPNGNERMVKGGGAGDGYQIDTYGGGPYGNPLYAADSPTGKEKNLGETPTVAGWGQHGWAFKDAKGAQQHQIAKLNDTPTMSYAKNAGQEFESVALAVEGKQAGTYMGSVSWGWSIDGAGKYTQKPLTLVSKGDPSKGFLAAAKQWNSVASFGNVKANASPTNIYDGTLKSVAFTVAKGTDLILTGNAVGDPEVFNDLTIGSGKEKGKVGYAKVNDLKDVGGANPVLKLPIP
ncbi:MAG TPA: DUF4157 domain-containing protein [Kofleriaceae bacterium]|jgi:hypothetical protein